MRTLPNIVPENRSPASLLFKFAQYAALYAEAGAGMSDAQRLRLRGESQEYAIAERRE